MNQKVLHHIGTSAGFLGLIAWYYAGHQLGVLDWAAQQAPVEYAGAGLMLGIMLVMTPGFFIWKLYNRWLERKLAVTGRYYEDEYYADFEKRQAEKKERQSRERDANRRDGANHHESSGMDSGGNDGGDGGGGD